MQSHFTYQIEALRKGWEEIIAASLITSAFFLTGWFYYNLYQALQDYKGF